MKTIYDLLRHLAEHAHWPLDEMKQEAHDLLDRLEAAAAEHVAAAVESVAQDPAAETPADQQTTMNASKPGK